jgi:putative ABC transport system substrate-binding protein
VKRREFIAGLGNAVAWPLVARAQQLAVPVIGYLDGGPRNSLSEFVTAFHRGLSEAGYVEGQNLAVEYRFAENRLDRLPGLAGDLVRRKVDVIAAIGSAAVFAAKAATISIPIVFVARVDPVQAGLVASLARPGGNVTGIADLNTAVATKRLELLHELLPAATPVAYLVNPTNAAFTEPEMREPQVAARFLSVRLQIVNAGDPSEFDAAFAALVGERAGGLVVSGELLFLTNVARLVAQAARYRVPAVFPIDTATAAGGLMSYGPDLFGSVRQAGVYTGRVLKGERPADLPVPQSTIIKLVINLKTAKALGLTFPTALLVRADEVIE